ncbi:MAG TPA: GNAT family N-acetyltransferase [Anaerolineales bacterium]|nr:GNAT family N-acetyltransferase [Anaerolineales bacterium]
MAESQFGFDDEGHWNSYPFGINTGEDPVGFLMYALNPAHPKIQTIIQRLMIDEKHQGKGYGRKAMELLLEEFRANKDIRVVAISYEEYNTGARKLYASLGCEERGDMTGDEIFAVFDLR